MVGQAGVVAISLPCRAAPPEGRSSISRRCAGGGTGYQQFVQRAGGDGGGCLLGGGQLGLSPGNGRVVGELGPRIAGRRRHSRRVRRARKMMGRRRFEIMIGVILSDLKVRVFAGL